MRKTLFLMICTALLAGCGVRAIPVAPSHTVRATPLALYATGCAVGPTERGIYSAVHGKDIYFDVFMSDTRWISESDSLVLLVNTHGSVEVEGIEYRFAFARSGLKKITASYAQAEIEVADIGASSGWVTAVTLENCYLGSFFFPFGRGNG